MKKQTKIGLVLAAAAVISVSVASLVSARGWVQQGSDWFYLDSNNDYVTETIQSSGSSKFYLGADGAMVRDYFLEDDGNNNTYYFGSNGAMVTNTWVAIDSSVVDGTDDYIPDNYWYYFQSSGKAIKGSTDSMKKTTIDGKKYGFNEHGQMAIGWVGDDGKTVSPDESNPFATATYYCGGDNDGALRSGWVTYYDGYADMDGDNRGDYTNLYFYFSPTNNKKKANKVNEKINGRYYSFDDAGVMLSGWDTYELGYTNKVSYYSGEDDGHQVKKGWIYEVPSASVDADTHEDNEEKYMYFDSTGTMKTNTVNTKINGKYYCFNDKGIMKTGIVIWNQDAGTFVNTIDLDYASGEDVVKHGKLTTGENSSITLDKDAKNGGVQYRLHYFGDDGARKTGLNNIEFNDGTYTLNTTSAGHKLVQKDKKKYYSLGIALKADTDLRYGIMASDSQLAPHETLYEAGLYDGTTGDYANYQVLTTSGSLQKGNTSARKDANENYWFIDKTTNLLMGIWTVNIKKGAVASGWTTKQYTNLTLATNSYTTAELNGILPGGLYDDSKDDPVDELDNYKWTVKKTTSGGTTYYSFVLAQKYTGLCYQSTYDGNSNKWLPFGFYDEVGSTQENYELTNLDDSYFLNCYWKD